MNDFIGENKYNEIMKRIDSRANSTFQRLISLLNSAGINKYGEFLLSGRKLVPEFCARVQKKAKAIIVAPNMPLNGLDLSPANSTPVIELAKKLFDELDILGTHYPIVWGEIPPVEQFDFAKSPCGLELLLALSNPLNLGAALRSAEAFWVDKVILLSECANPFLPRVIRASSGSALRLGWSNTLAHGQSIHALASPQMAAELWALDKNGRDISQFKFPKNFRLLIGEEGKGIPAEFSAEPYTSHRLSILMKPDMDSLNAVAATSIGLYAYRAQWPMPNRSHLP